MQPHKEEDKDKFLTFRTKDIFEILTFLMGMMIFILIIQVYLTITDYKTVRLYDMLTIASTNCVFIVIWFLGRKFKN